MTNMTLLSGNTTNMIKWLSWTNQIAGEWAIGTFLVFFVFLLPLIYLISAGKDKIESVMIASLVASVLMYFFSLSGLVPQVLVITMFILTAVSLFYHTFVHAK